MGQGCFTMEGSKETSQRSGRGGQNDPESTILARGRFDREACQERRKWLEGKLGQSFPHLGVWWSSEGAVRDRGLESAIENPIGFTMVPVGVAGPLLIKGVHAQGEFFAPISTVEGSLVASMSRGAKVVSLSGGVKNFSGRQRMARAPLFATNSPQAADLLASWMLTARERMDPIIKSITRNSELKEMHFMQDFADLHVYLAYETGDAAGQNMTTIATDALVEWIEKTAPAEIGEDKIQILHTYVDAGFTGDKKDTTSNHLFGRGLACFASADIPEQDKLHTTSENLMRFWRSLRSTLGGISSSGPYINIPNTLAGIFISTGQDAACLTESSYGQTDLLPLPDGGVRITVKLPCLVIGTVGGGTTLPTQRECLEMLDCVGPGKVRKLGEIIAGFTLCSELSLIASLATGGFAKSMSMYNHPDKKISHL